MHLVIFTWSLSRNLWSLFSSITLVKNIPTIWFAHVYNWVSWLQLTMCRLVIFLCFRHACGTLIICTSVGCCHNFIHSIKSIYCDTQRKQSAMSTIFNNFVFIFRNSCKVDNRLLFIQVLRGSLCGWEFFLMKSFRFSKNCCAIQLYFE